MGFPSQIPLESLLEVPQSLGEKQENRPMAINNYIQGLGGKKESLVWALKIEKQVTS